MIALQSYANYFVPARKKRNIFDKTLKKDLKGTKKAHIGRFMYPFRALWDNKKPSAVMVEGDRILFV